MARIMLLSVMRTMFSRISDAMIMMSIMMCFVMSVMRITIHIAMVYDAKHEAYCDA